jgi:hypothetical protein
MDNTRAVYNWLNVATVIVLISLSLSQLVFQFFGFHSTEIIGRIAFLGLCLCMVPIFKLREWVLITIAILLAIGLSQRSSGADEIFFALDRAAFFAAFIYLVTLLKEAAQRSNSVLQLGVFLTRQPPGKRFYSLAFGGHIMGVLLNFGAISLLTPLIQRGARAGGMSTDKQRLQAGNLEQQQISALIRGFAWMIMWSPTALTQVVLFTSFPTIDLKIVIPLGILSSLVMVFLGRIEDRFRWRHVQMDISYDRQLFPKRAAIRFSIICTMLIGATFIIAYLTNVSGALALMLVAPLIMVGWIFEQSFETKVLQAAKSTYVNLGEILSRTSNVLGRSAFTLGAAGFIGEAAAKLAPIEMFAAHLETFAMPGWIILVSLPIIINLCGQIALSPILVVVFLSSVINQLPVLPADPNLIVFALGAGWALSMTASPNASATLLISGVTGIPATTLTWRWNGIYALLCFAVFAVSFYLLVQVME